jgi:hypothetical protein
MRSLALFLPLTACVWETPVTLAELRPTLAFRGGPESLLGDMTFDDTNLPSCAVFVGSFSATINGERVDIDEPWVSTDQYCLESPIDFTFEDPPTAEVATFVMADDSLEIAAKLGDTYMPRTLGLASDAEVPIGELLTFRWDHPGDLLRYKPRVVVDQGGPLHTWANTEVTVDGDLIQFELPIDKVHPGPTVLEIVMTTDDVTFPCTGSTCELYAWPRASQSVVLR